MKLKETTLDQRLCAGLVCLLCLVLGFLTTSNVSSKVSEFCGGVTVDPEVWTLRLYVLLATLGVGLGVLHVLSAFRFRK